MNAATMSLELHERGIHVVCTAAVKRGNVDSRLSAAIIIGRFNSTARAVT
jgi:hypothetical protein